MHHQALFDALEQFWKFTEQEEPVWSDAEDRALGVLICATASFPDASLEAFVSVDLTLKGDSVSGYTPEAGMVTVKDQDKNWKKDFGGLPKGRQSMAVGHWKVKRYGTDPTSITAEHFWSTTGSRGLRGSMSMRIRYAGSHASCASVSVWRDILFKIRAPGGGTCTLTLERLVWSRGTLPWRLKIYAWLSRWLESRLHNEST